MATKVSIVVDDNRVSVNNEPHLVDLSRLIAEDIYALQWYGTFGELEYRNHFIEKENRWDRKPNAIIKDFSPFQWCVDGWVRQREIDAAAKLVAGVDNNPDPSILRDVNANSTR